MSLTLEKKHIYKKEFFSGDYVIYALKGIYRIEHIDVLSLTGTPDKYYVLSDSFNKTIHKTFVPVKTAIDMGMRTPTSPKVFEQLEEIVQSLELQPEEIKNNSNKKILSYETRIRKHGFIEMLHSYFCVHHDLRTTRREEKRYIQFLERLKNMICAEMSLVTGTSLELCLEHLESISKKYQSQ